MKNKFIRSLLSVLLVIVIVAAMALSLTACGSKGDTENTGTQEAKTTDTQKVTTGAEDSKDATGDTKKAGEKVITVDVTDDKGAKTTFTITTDAEFLRAALEQEKLIEGEESEFGLYIKVVNGVKADYDTDGAYWALSQDGEYLMTGVDTTPIADGGHYELTYTK